MSKYILSIAALIAFSPILLGADKADFKGSPHQSFGAAKPIQSSGSADNVTWIPIADAGQPFGRADGGIVGDYFYVFGYIEYPRAQALNWHTEHWELSTPPPLGNCNYAGVAAAGAIYLIGRYYDYSFGSEVQIFTPDTIGPCGTWNRVADYPLAVGGIAAAYDGADYIYAAGGGDLVDYYANAYKYDLAADAWSEIAPLPREMAYHGAAFIQGEFHVMGGALEPSNAHYAYDPQSDTWTPRATMPVPNTFAAFSVTSNDNYIFSIGGGGGYHIWQATDAVQIYDPATDSWTQENPLPAAYGLNTAVCAPGGAILSVGGYSDTTYVPRAFKGTGFPTLGNSEVEDISLNPAPTGFTLNSAYPNPFNNVINFCFNLPLESGISLLLYDLNGKTVADLSPGTLSTGRHTLSFDAANLASGVYFANISDGKSSQTKRVILLK